MKKYDILKPEYAICCYSRWNCLVYGNNQDGKGLILESDFLINESKEDLSSKVFDVPSDFCLSGEEYFNVEEVEVYQIIFE